MARAVPNSKAEARREQLRLPFDDEEGRGYVVLTFRDDGGDDTLRSLLYRLA